jgi:4'-phosphopantetheinyl transferase EntD
MDEAAMADLFAAPVAIRVAETGFVPPPRHPVEAALVSRAIERRRQEFAVGRACARSALAALEAPQGPILRSADRAPIWPPGFVGSITHCEGFCCAVAAHDRHAKALGVDAEPAQPFDAGLRLEICTPAELDHFAGLPEARGFEWANLAFSAKEAFYKAYYPLTLTTLDFLDVTIRFESGVSRREGNFAVAVHNPAKPLHGERLDFIGRWRVAAGRIYTAATVLRTGDDAVAGRTPPSRGHHAG